MRILFMGTPQFAVAPLKALVDGGHEVVAVISQPSRPRGRGRHPEETPVAVAARSLGLPLLQPERVNDPAIVAQIREMAPEAIVVAAFGQILRPALLEIPPLGCLNVHASLLPRYRGAAPVQHALLNGETLTGVTIMQMDAGLDTGPILMQQEVPIDPNDTAGTLLERLSRVGAHLILNVLSALAERRLQPVPQDPAQATYAPTLTREDARLDFRRPADSLRNQVRAFNPKPGAWLIRNKRELKVWQAEVEETHDPAPPGQVQEIAPKGIRVATGKGSLWLTQVQEAGRARLSAAAFARGARLKVGDRLPDDGA